MNAWEILLQRALVILRSAAAAGSFAREWTLGGGTALMLRYAHRRSEALEEQYEALDTLRAAPKFGDSVRIVRALLAPLRKTPRAEQRCAAYDLRPSRCIRFTARPENVVCP